jgi:hypothetical protein
MSMPLSMIVVAEQDVELARREGVHAVLELALVIWP